MARGGLFNFGQADDTEAEYDKRKKREEEIRRRQQETNPKTVLPLGSGGAKQAADALSGRAARLKKLEEENGI